MQPFWGRTGSPSSGNCEKLDTCGTCDTSAMHDSTIHGAGGGIL